MTDNFDSVLDGIKVLDITEDRGLYAGKLLADFGADVIKIENPAGSRARTIGPFKNDIPGADNSLYFINFNTNKRGITLDLKNPEGKEIFKHLVRHADVVLEDYEPGVMKSLGLDYINLRELNNRLVMASVTGFGQTGPYSHFNSPDIVNFAMGGLMYQSGAANEPPVVPPCEQAYQSASIMTAFGVLSALFLRLSTGEGQYVDVASHEVIAFFSQDFMRYSVTSGLGGRTGSQFPAAPARIYPCKDGYVHFLVFYPNHWKSFLELVGNPEMFMDKAWYEAYFRVRNTDLIDPLVLEFTKDKTKDEVTRLCQEKGIPVTPVNTPADFSKDIHFKERGFFTEIEHPVIGRHTYLNPPVKFSESPCRITRPAPMLGQHNREIFVGELGYKEQDLARLKAESII
jgi:crotonobetainyl-CoA:carnitine CoA-transferase CaiB-like acyl-CoA transferase